MIILNNLAYKTLSMIIADLILFHLTKQVFIIYSIVLVCTINNTKKPNFILYMAEKDGMKPS